MPYPNYHAARVKSPASFKSGSFRTKTLSNGIILILGRLKGESNLTVQSYRFPKDKFTASQARTWLKENKIKPILFEAASGKE